MKSRDGNLRENKTKHGRVWLAGEWGRLEIVIRWNGSADGLSMQIGFRSISGGVGLGPK